MMMNGFGGWMGLGLLAMWLNWLVPVVLLGLVVWLVCGRGCAWRSAPAGKDALAILRERYARGEISRDEYLQARRDLEEK